MKCQKVDKECKYCSEYESEMYRGLSLKEKRKEDKHVVENRIRRMKACPKKKK